MQSNQGGSQTTALTSNVRQERVPVVVDPLQSVADPLQSLAGQQLPAQSSWTTWFNTPVPVKRRLIAEIAKQLPDGGEHSVVIHRICEVAGDDTQVPEQLLSDLVRMAVDSLRPSSMPEGVSDTMRLEHFRSRWQMRLASHSPQAVATTTNAMRADADKELDDLRLATALSMSDHTAHLPRIHAFFASESSWIEPTSSFLHMACKSGRPGAFQAFQCLTQKLLRKHLLDADTTEGSLTLRTFADFCVLTFPGGMFDDLTWVDKDVLESARLLMCVESEELFDALLQEYKSLVCDDEIPAKPRDSNAEQVDAKRWDEYFDASHLQTDEEDPNQKDQLRRNSNAAALSHEAMQGLLDLRSSGFSQYESPHTGGEVEEREVVDLRVRRGRWTGTDQESLSLAMALREARLAQGLDRGGGP